MFLWDYVVKNKSQSAKEEFKLKKIREIDLWMECHNLPKRNLNFLVQTFERLNSSCHNLPKRNLNSLLLQRMHFSICRHNLPKRNLNVGNFKIWKLKQYCHNLPKRNLNDGFEDKVLPLWKKSQSAKEEFKPMEDMKALIERT